HQSGSGEPAAPRRQSLLRAQARYALLPAATPREGRFAPAADIREARNHRTRERCNSRHPEEERRRIPRTGGVLRGTPRTGGVLRGTPRTGGVLRGTPRTGGVLRG